MKTMVCHNRATKSDVLSIVSNDTHCGKRQELGTSQTLYHFFLVTIPDLPKKL